MRKGSVSVAEFRPDLVDQWSSRNDRGPDEVARGSYYKAHWVGVCGHEWVASVDNRCYNNTGCPFCVKRGWKKVRPGENDFQTRFPEMAKQWHPTRNGSLNPHEILPGANKKVWWMCPECGKEWEALIKARTGRNSGCASCRGRKRGLKTSGSCHWVRLYGEWSEKNTLKLNDFSETSRHRAHWVCKNGHEFRSAIGDRNLKQTGCKQCGLGGTSTAERELSELVKSFEVEVRNHHRQIHPAFEYDVTVPDKLLAIEYNGIYWHSEKHKPGTDYHWRKTLAAKEAGWKVLHIWEDDWNDKKEVVVRAVARKLGKSKEERLNARSLEIAQVTAKDAREFLNNNHIQGFTVGSLHLALKKRGEVVAVMTMKKVKDGEYRLERYATSAIVRGGFSRLFKNAVKILSARKIITFSDNAMSDGNLYESHGFENDGELAPDYMYVVKNKREHKFNYRKARFKKDPNLKYEEGLSERELAQLNGLERIWDAGKIRWVWIA